jgi:hypothetical protein
VRIGTWVAVETTSASCPSIHEQACRADSSIQFDGRNVFAAKISLDDMGLFDAGQAEIKAGVAIGVSDGRNP